MLDWLTSVQEELDNLENLEKIKQKIKANNFTNIVLLGMGGSSIGPKVFQAILAPSCDFFHVLDTTHPKALTRLCETIDLAHTLFIVASKSGSTLEPQVLYRYFLARLEQENILEPARHFMAITDPVSPLEQESQEQGFLPGPFGEPNIGGRYSALSAFGLMPALLMNIDIKRLLERAWPMTQRCREHSSALNPGLHLGEFLAQQVQSGRDQLVFRFSKPLEPFGWWLEQLIAESLGKNNSGIVPIINHNNCLDPDKIAYCYIKLGEDNLDIINNNKIPSYTIKLDTIYDLGAEMFRWQIAISIAGVLLGLNPFDQPNVEQSKELARDFLNIMIKNPQENLLDKIKIYNKSFDKFLEQARNKSYAAILSFLDNTPAHTSYLEKLQEKLSQKLAIPVLIQQGPSYLHSTGQLFKGGKNEGCFIVITGPYEFDLPSLYAQIGIKAIHISQAFGDTQAMGEGGRLVSYINYKNTTEGFQELLILLEN